MIDINKELESCYKRREVKYIAHRGFSKLAPENTLPAYELAGEHKFWGAETDIHTTKEGVWVCIHDTLVDRTTNGKGDVNNFTLQGIKDLDVDYGNNILLYPRLKIPTLEEYLESCTRNNMYPIIEIKKSKMDSAYDSLLECIRKYDIENKCAIISFDYEALQEVRKRSNNIYIQYLSDITDETVLKVKDLGNAGFDCEYTRLTQELIDKAHKENILVNCWTVDTVDEIEELINIGIDMITVRHVAI